MTTPKLHYDVVVAGSSLGGLVAGALLARRNFRVLVLSGPADPAPDPRPLVGLERPAWKRVIGELNVMQLLRRRLAAQRPAYQLVLPTVRIDVHDDELLRAHELARALPAEATALRAHLGRSDETARLLDPLFGEDLTLPPDGFWARRELARIEPRLPRALDDLFPGLAEGAPGRLVSLAPAVATVDAWPPTPTAVARAGATWRDTPQRLTAGWDDLRRLLGERIELHGGELRAATASHLELRRGRVAAVVAGEERVGAGFVVFAEAASALLPLLGPDAKPPKALARAALLCPPAAQRVSMRLQLREAGLPEGLGDVAFLAADPAGPLHGDALVALYTSPREGETVTLTAQVVAPLGVDLDALGEAVFARLLALMPFLPRHLVSRAAPTTTTLWSSAQPQALGICGLPHETGFKNVLFVSSQSIPGAGAEGEAVAAWGAARIVSQADKRRDVLEQKVLKG